MAEDQAPSFSKGQIQDVLNTRDALKEIQRSMVSMNKENKEFNKDFAQIYRSADNFAKAQETARKNTKSNNQLIKEANNLIGQSAKLNAQISLNETKRRNILKDINKIYAKAAKNDKELTASQKNKVRLLGIEVDELQNKSQHLADASDHAKSLGGTYKQLSNESMSMSRNIYGTLGGLSEMLKLDQNLTDGFSKANELQRERKIIALEEADLRDRMTKALVDYNKELKKQKKDPVSMDQFRSGKGMTRERLSKFGLDRYTEGRTGSAAGSTIKTAEQGMATSKSALGSTLTPILKGIGSMLKAFTKGLVLVKAMAFVAEAIQYAFFGADQEAVDLARSMNIGRDAGYQMRENMVKMQKSMSIVGTDIQPLVKFQLEFTKHTGTSARLNADQLETAILMTNQMGLTNDQAIHLIDNFKASGMGAREGLDALRQSYNQLYNSNQTAMNFNQLMDDITKDTELQYIFQTQGADAAMRNANAVRRTGLSLSQQRSMAEGTLDFEKTMTNQLELQMLTGKNINLNKAQELALQGRNGEAVAEMQKQMGQLTAEQQKNPLIMNKMLELLGMSREEYYAQQNAIREQNALLVAQQKAKDKFNKADFEFGQKYYDMLEEKGKQSVQSAIKFAYSKSEAEGKRVEDEIAAIEERMIKEGEAHATEEEQLALRKKAFKEFHETSLHNAKVRHGVASGEIKTLETQLSASEAFNAAMNELKTLLSTLVNSKSLQYLTDTLIDFVQRAKQVGFGRAMLGGGDSKEEIAEDNAARLETFNRKGIGEKSTAEDIKRALAVDLGNNAKRIDEAVLDSIAEKTSKEALREALNMLSAGQRGKKISSTGGGVTTIDDYLKNAETAGDFILRPGQPAIKYDKGDLVMGGTQLGMGGGKVEQLLEELLAETKAGKVIKMDAGAVGRSLQLNKSKMSY